MTAWARSNPYPDFQEWQPSPSPSLLSSEEEDNTPIDEDQEIHKKNCVPETDKEGDWESHSLYQSEKCQLEEKLDIHESIKELKTLLHAVCAKVEKNEESLKMLHVQYNER